MGDKTSIEWTDATFNPWWGCTKVSPGCDHCYAEGIAQRFSPGIWGPRMPRRQFTEEHWLKPVEWNSRALKSGQRMRVFCASMGDVFDNGAPEGVREMLWDTIERTPRLDWQVLTKRVGNVESMVPERWMTSGFPSHVWLGISVVNQNEADRDVPELLALPARIRWVSCEPLLGPLFLVGYLGPQRRALSWVVAGGESGKEARPMHPYWARELRDQCVAAGVPFLFKQWGEWRPICEGGPDWYDSLYRSNRKASGWETQAEVDEVYGRRCVVGQAVIHIDGSKHGVTDANGKKAAGRTLDGRTWNEYPTPALGA